MLYLVLWLVCGAFAMQMTQRKGHSMGIAILLGLFGLLGLLIAFLIPANQTGAEWQQIKSGQMIKCPHCAEMIRPDAKVCRYCQRNPRSRDDSQPPLFRE